MSSWITSDWAGELRDIWNSYDPIGVYAFEDDSEWPNNEYDGYHGLVLSLLKSNADDYKFLDRLKHVVTVNIGMNWTPQLETDTKTFIRNARSWFDAKQAEIKS